MIYFFFFFNDTATTEIYTLSLHDALPISARAQARLPHPETPGDELRGSLCGQYGANHGLRSAGLEDTRTVRSEEHTSELQSRPHLVCRLLLEKKKTIRAECPYRCVTAMYS